MDTTQALVGAGFDDKEAKVYTSLLSLGATTASKLAEYAEIDRTSTYDVLARLMKRGMVSYVVQNNTKYFQAAPPEQILVDLKEKEKQIESVMPNLMALTKLEKEDTKVEVYKGREGIRTIYKMMLRDKSGYYWMGGGSEACKKFPGLTESFVKKAHASKIKGKLIFREDAKFFVGKSEEYRLIEKEYISSTTTTIWGEKVAVFIWSEPFYAIVIENKEVAESNRNNFRFLWKQSRKPSESHMKKTTVG
jgi:sugar-specific transcriptional regulator TrmB